MNGGIALVSTAFPTAQKAEFYMTKSSALVIGRTNNRTDKEMLKY